MTSIKMFAQGRLSKNAVLWMIFNLMIRLARGDEDMGGGMGGGMGGDSDEAEDKLTAAMGDNDDEDDRPITHGDLMNRKYAYTLLGLFVLALVVQILWQLIGHMIKYVRQASASGTDKQRLFAESNPRFAWLKEHLFYAPMFRVRHNRELRFGRHLDFGCLPTRFQALFLLSYLGIQVTFIVVDINWTANKRGLYSQLRNRCGALAVANLIPLILFASRHNPLIGLLNISYDSFNMLHRWMGRITALEGLTHAAMWFVFKLTIDDKTYEGAKLAFLYDPMITTGSIAAFSFIGLVMFSPASFRKKWYEFFLHLHQIFGVGLIVGLWMHISVGGKFEFIFLEVALGIWIVERSIRLFIIAYYNVGNGGTKALLEALPGGAVRITIAMARPWRFKAGQHLFLYVPSVGLWTSHPFSVAWSEEAELFSPTGEKGMGLTHQDTMSMRRTTISLVIRQQRGFTAKMFKKADSSPDKRVMVTAYVEGPRGALHSLHSYGTVVLFAGGVGITHQVPYVRDLVAGYANGTVAARRVVLIWIIQTPEHLEWVRPWMTTILGMERRSEVLRILLFVTRPRTPTEVQSPSSTVSMFPGKPNIETLIDMEIESQVGAMAVSVCGPGSLSDDVRRIVRRRQHISNIDYVEESFSW